VVPADAQEAHPVREGEDILTLQAKREKKRRFYSNPSSQVIEGKNAQRMGKECSMYEHERMYEERGREGDTSSSLSPFFFTILHCFSLSYIHTRTFSTDRHLS
jgi:hypothetical protein